VKTRGSTRLGLLAVAAGWLAACASTGGGGTNTNWTECETQEDCEGSAACVDGRCVLDDSGAGSGGRASGSGGAPACPAYADWPPPGASFEPYQGRPSDFSAETFGCYPSRRLVVIDGRPWPASGPDCRGNTRCTYEPGDLPCGPCTARDEACFMGVWAACNCGDGPFLQSYTDQWACQCIDGQWDCRIVAPSGASCQNACDDAGAGAGGASSAGGAGGASGGSSGGAGGTPAECGPTLRFELVPGNPPASTAYCNGKPQSCGGGPWLTVLDPEGHPVTTHRGSCSPQPCDVCSSAVCPPFCESSRPITPQGIGVDWTGTLWAQATCGAESVVCLSPSCAPAGRYTARFCGYRLEGGDGGPLACESNGSETPTCVDVPFDYPHAGTILGVLDPGG